MKNGMHLKKIKWIFFKSFLSKKTYFTLNNEIDFTDNLYLLEMTINH